MKSFVLISLLILTETLFGQSLLENRGNKAYNKLAYSRAADFYTSAAGKGKLSEQGMLRLGDCYRLSGQWGRAEEWYGNLAKKEKATSEVIYYYAQALRFNGKYEESELQMAKFYSMQQSDSRANEFNSKPGFIQAIRQQQPYFNIANLDVNTSQSDFGAAFYNNDVIFASARPLYFSKQNYHTWSNSPFLDLYRAGRNDDGQLVNISLFDKDISTKYHEGPACFSQDGKTMYFTRNNYFRGKYKKSKGGVNNLKIFRAKLVGTTWVEEDLSINSDEYSAGHPALSPDGAWLYFASDMPGAIGETDIYRCAINTDGSIGIPENLGITVNTEGKEMFPFLDRDGNLFFASDGHLGLGGLDIFYSAKEGNNGFAEALNPGLPINGSSDDFALVLDNTGQSGYFSSNRTGGKGDDDIYSVNVLRPFKTIYTLSGHSRDYNDLLPGVTIYLENEKGEVIDSSITGSDASYQFKIEPGKTYRLSAFKDRHMPAGATIVTPESQGASEIISDVVLLRLPEVAFQFAVVDAGVGMPVDSVRITVTEKKNGFTMKDTLADKNGLLVLPLNVPAVAGTIQYTITYERKGYLSKSTEVTADPSSPQSMVIQQRLDKVQVGADLAVILSINPIYFDLGKSAIRPDAAIELDKIVKVMNENPSMVVELGSHTDCRSSAASNLALSERRAKASADYIKKRITNPERISGKGYGESQLVNGCACEGDIKPTCSEEEHQKNRRTEFKIIKM